MVDLPMLRLCEEVTVVNPGERLLAIAEAEGWEVVRPERPFLGRSQMGWRRLKQMVGFDGAFDE